MAASEATALELRDAFGSTLVELGHEYPEMVFLDGDLHTSTKAVLFKESFPSRFYQIGIAEQNLFGVAAGLALEGFIPIPSTFASFVVRRALDQIAISIAYPRLNVKIPGSYVGVPTSRAGASHNCIEDTAVMRSIPHFRIADPGSNRDLASVMRVAMQTDGPVYYRVARYAVPEFLPDDYAFEWGRATILRSGTDVTLLGTGFMTFSCLETADLLAKNGLDAEVIHCASIKPLDAETICGSLARTGCAVTAENASTIGGFGAAVTELVSETAPAVVLRVGVRDAFVESGGCRELLGVHGMLPADIAAKAEEATRLRDSAGRFQARTEEAHARS